MEDIVITHEKVLDNIVIEDQFKYQVFITIGLTKLNDYYIKLDFTDLDFTRFIEAKNLYDLNQALKFNSELVKKLELPITHIVAEKFQGDNQYQMTWECLSDEPGFRL